MPPLRRVLTLLLATPAVFYVLVCVAAFLGQRALLYPAPKSPLATLPERLGFGHVKLASGEVVDTLYVPASEGAPTLVHFHGNAEQLLGQIDLANAMQRRGVGFLAVEYPGYGASPGSPSEEGLYAAAEAALAMLRGKGVPAERTVLSGRSLGTGVAVEMARRGHGTRLVLVSPYTSITRMAAKTVPWLPAWLLVRDRFDSEKKAPQVKVPVFILHGEADQLVPVEMGRQLARLFPNVTLETVPNAGHDDILEHGGVQRMDHIAAFAFPSGNH